MILFVDIFWNLLVAFFKYIYKWLHLLLFVQPIHDIDKQDYVIFRVGILDVVYVESIES